MIIIVIKGIRISISMCTNAPRQSMLDKDRPNSRTGRSPATQPQSRS